MNQGSGFTKSSMFKPLTSFVMAGHPAPMGLIVLTSLHCFPCFLDELVAALPRDPCDRIYAITRAESQHDLQRFRP